MALNFVFEIFCCSVLNCTNCTIFTFTRELYIHYALFANLNYLCFYFPICRPYLGRYISVFNPRAANRSQSICVGFSILYLYDNKFVLKSLFSGRFQYKTEPNYVNYSTDSNLTENNCMLVANAENLFNERKSTLYHL